LERGVFDRLGTGGYRIPKPDVDLEVHAGAPELHDERDPLTTVVLVLADRLDTDRIRRDGRPEVGLSGAARAEADRFGTDGGFVSVGHTDSVAFASAIAVREARGNADQP
jgi:hypothetical protein